MKCWNLSVICQNQLKCQNLIWVKSWESNKKVTFVCKKVGIEIWGKKTGIDENVVIWLENKKLNRILKNLRKKSMKMLKFEC